MTREGRDWSMFAGGIGMPELLVIFLLVLLLFGAKRIPEVGRSFGRGIREFKGAMKEINSSVDADGEEAPAKPRPAAGSEARRAAPAGEGNEKKASSE
jgi:sec-independent protein translocase protein TatA